MVKLARYRGRCAAAILLSAVAYAQAPQPERQPILAYIKQTWAVLTRSNRGLAQSAADPRFQPEPDGRWPVYLARDDRLRRYPFLTTFYPLWAGIASREQAAAVARNLPLFERPGGLQASTHVSGDQWDAPFAWAPLEMIAVEGWRRYGYTAEAGRISREFLSMVDEQYRERGIIVEKYDAVRRSMDVSRGIQFGYSSNETGFGWTNAVFTKLFDELPPAGQQQVLQPAPR